MAIALPNSAEVEAEAPFEAPLMPDMPRSWVPRLRINQEMMDMRCPKGIRAIQYWRCQHELFAVFGETSRWDGLAERLTIYQVICLMQCIRKALRGCTQSASIFVVVKVSWLGLSHTECI